MKNLKKVLALGLALVMMLGMMSIAAAADTKMVASDLTDWDDVENKDAVSLCVDLGIINGIPQADGSVAYKPADNIDRASWSQLVYFTLTNDTDAAAYIPSTPAYSDVKGNWAEGQISYLSSIGVIAGQGDGTYNPNGNITVAAGAVTLLTGLGYDREKQGYLNNTAWDTLVMRDAKKYGLMDGITARSGDMLTRDTAAQMIYNALNANVVSTNQGRDNGEWYTSSYDIEATLGYEVFGIVKVTATIDKIESDGTATFKTGSTSPSGITAANLNGKIKASAALVGEEVVVFVKATGSYDSDGDLYSATGFKSVVSSTAAKGSKTPISVVTGGIKLDDAFDKDSDDFIADDATTVTYYLNGASSDHDKVAAVTDKAGVVVEFYDDDNGDISIVKAYNYTVKQVGGDVETKTVDDVLKVKVPGVIGTWTDAAKVDGYQGLVEDDVVLFYRNTDSDTYVIEKADMISGKVTTKNSSGELTVNGSKYKKSGLTSDWGDISSTDKFEDWTNKDDEFEFYLDKNGTICYVVQVTESTDKSKVAIVLDVAWVNGGGLASSKYLEAKLLFVDGTTEIVTVSKLDGTSIDEDNGQTTATTLASAKEAKFYNYKVSDGKYQLTEMKSGDDWTATDTDVTGQVSQKSGFNDNSDYTADSKTLFVVAKGNKDDGYTYYTYTGFKNVPEMTASKGIAIAEKDKTVAKYVYLVTDIYDSDTPDGYIFIRNAKWEEDPNNADCYLINIVNADGESTTLSVNEDVRDALVKEGSAMPKSFQEITKVNENGVVTEFNATAPDPKDGIVIGNEVVKLDSKTYDYDNTTVCVVIDMDEDGAFDSAGTFDPDNVDVKTGDANSANFDTVKALVIGTEDKTADYIYLIRTPAKATPAAEETPTTPAE